MDLENVKERVGSLLQQLAQAIELLRAVGGPEDKVTILEDTEYFLSKLLDHINVLESESSLAVLESELREMNLTLKGLRETLLLWDPPDQSLVAEVDAAQKEVRKNLGKVKSGRSVKRKAPVLLVGAFVAAAAYSSLNR